jgi:anti-sigma factor RsiW
MRYERVCKTSKSETLSAYADGMLDGQGMRRMAHHLESCEDCRESFEEMSRYKELLGSLRTAPGALPATFWSQAYRTARLSVASDEAVIVKRDGILARGPKWRFAALTAMSVAAIGMAFIPIGALRGVAPQPVEAAQVLDVNALVDSHANVTQDEPLADHSRLTMIESDTAAQQAGDNVQDSLDANPTSD